MKKVVLASRILLGLVFLVFGANGLMMFTVGQGFIPMPEPKPEMMTVMNGFMATGYLLFLVKLIEVVAGVLLLAGKYVNAAIVLLAPIVVNILGIHLFADRSGAPMAIIITVLLCILIRDRWAYFKPLLAKD